MNLIVKPDGIVDAIYSEEIALVCLGHISIQRASHVEPDADGKWWADLAPVNGPRLGPFYLRSQALEAESNWLTDWLDRFATTGTNLKP
jgi:hypothetical protein